MAEFDYVVVGSGAGGGPLAARLAEKGKKVLLLEAGSSGEDSPNYSVPAFHAFATEDESMKWDYYVNHYQDEEQQQRDAKIEPEDSDHAGKIWYPRAGTLGGCTAHYAMIIVYPHASDWDHIAEITKDNSWKSGDMRQYFQKVENHRYLNSETEPSLPSLPSSKHGTEGWLPVTQADPRTVLGDDQLLNVIGAAISTATQRGLVLINAICSRLGILEQACRKLVEELSTKLTPTKAQQVFTNAARNRSLLFSLPVPVPLLRPILNALLDPNDADAVGKTGLLNVPTAADGKRRAGSRERIQAVSQNGNLTVRTNVLVHRVLFKDGPENIATGVEFSRGKHLYQADPNYNPDADLGPVEQVFVRKEVIISAGAFNTPQLLKLSGIGPEAELKDKDIEVRVPLPGVGANLQDRYEVGIVGEVDNEFDILKGCRLGLENDPCVDAAKDNPLHPYNTNGVIMGTMMRSKRVKDDGGDPDLFIFGAPGHFRGYFRGYSDLIRKHRNRFTWAVLKAHTINTAGTVTLQSADPRHTPVINFNYFEEGSSGWENDLEAVADGVEYVKEIITKTDGMTLLHTHNENDDRENLETRDGIKRYIKNQAWGHHASCTCKIGSDTDAMAVLDSKFKRDARLKLEIEKTRPPSQA